MNLLLDTHVALWLVRGDTAMGATARQAIFDADKVYVSVASIWEIAIKHSIGKLGPPEPVVAALTVSGIQIFDITTEHVISVVDSPLSHSDPFDRLIVAQAQSEKWALCTADSKILGAQLHFVIDAHK